MPLIWEYLKNRGAGFCGIRAGDALRRGDPGSIRARIGGEECSPYLVWRGQVFLDGRKDHAEENEYYEKGNCCSRPEQPALHKNACRVIIRSGRRQDCMKDHVGNCTGDADGDDFL